MRAPSAFFSSSVHVFERLSHEIYYKSLPRSDRCPFVSPFAWRTQVLSYLQSGVENFDTSSGLVVIQHTYLQNADSRSLDVVPLKVF